MISSHFYDQKSFKFPIWAAFSAVFRLHFLIHQKIVTLHFGFSTQILNLAELIDWVIRNLYFALGVDYVPESNHFN
jgi:hypothetical protein